jgi:hypothetical protein
MLQRIKIKSATININIIVNKINEKEASDLIQDNWSCQEYPLGNFLIKKQQLRLKLKKITEFNIFMSWILKLFLGNYLKRTQLKGEMLNKYNI